MIWLLVWYYFVLMLKRPDLQARESVHLGDGCLKLHSCGGPWWALWMLYWYFYGSTIVVDLTQKLCITLAFFAKIATQPSLCRVCTGTQGCLGEPQRGREAKDVQKGVLFPLLYSWGLWGTAGLSALPAVLLCSALVPFQSGSAAGPCGFSSSQSDKGLGL